MKRLNLTVPSSYEKAGKTIKKYTRVGSAFINEKDGQTTINIKLDFPVAVTELVAFEPKERDDDQNGDDNVTE